MPDITAFGLKTEPINVYDYKIVGTAAGTTTIKSEPGFLLGIVIPTRVASGVITIYDSIGTSGTVIGTITLGTQTFSDPPPTYWFNVRTKNALTVANSGNQGAVVLFG